MDDIKMAYDKSSRKNKLGQLRQIIRALGPAFAPALFLLAPEAYLSRILALRSPFSPTLYKRRRILEKASLKGRHLSKEPYLRPTTYCNCHAPELIALAEKFRRTASNDWDFAVSIYDFVRNDISFAIDFFPRNGAVGTFEMRYGLCTDKANALIALARAGGIPARYCHIGNLSPSEVETVQQIEQLIPLVKHFEAWEKSTDWRLRKIGGGMMRHVKRELREVLETPSENGIGQAAHVLAELKIGNSWILADTTWSDQEAVAYEMPLPRLGYDPIALSGIKGTVIDRSEDIQAGSYFWITRWLFCLAGRGLLDITNQALENKREEGRRLLAEIDEKEYMRSKKRYYVPLPQATALKISL